MILNLSALNINNTLVNIVKLVKIHRNRIYLCLPIIWQTNYKIFNYEHKFSMKGIILLMSNAFH